MGPLPDLGPAITIMVVLSVVGLLALLAGAGWMIWYLVTHLAWIN